MGWEQWVAIIALVGYFLALMIFFVAFLRIVAKAGWLQTLLLTALAAVVLMALTSGLNLVLPEGLLQDRFYDQLFWPLV